MKIERIRHENVLPDGTFSNERGAVVTTGSVRMSQENGGCEIETCHCSDGHWLSIIQPRTDDGVVEGIKMIFNDKAEMDAFLAQRELNG